MATKNKKLILILFVLVISLASALVMAKNFSVQETDLVKLRADTFDIDDDVVYINYSPPLNKTGEWQTGYDDAGSYNVKITASDGEAFSSKLVTLIVEEKNRAPEVSHSPITVQEGEMVKLNLPQKDIDGNLLTYNFEKPLNNNGEWKTTYEDAGVYRFEITASDGELTDTATIEIIVLNVDQEPIFNVPERLNVYENEILEWQIDAFDPDGNKITINFTNLPEGASFNEENKMLTWTPSFDIVSRGNGLLSDLLNALRLENIFLLEKDLPPLKIKMCSADFCMEKEVKIIVHNVNRKPSFELPENLTVMETEEIKLKVEAVDLDGDFVQYSFSSPLEKRKGSWKPEFGDRGEYTVYVTASDGKNEETIPINITVLPLNKKPKIKIKNDELVVNENELLQFSVDAVDPDGTNLTVHLTNLPQGASFQDGTFSWVPPYTIVTNKSGRWEDNLISNVAVLNRAFSSESNIRWLEFSVNDGEFEIIHPVKITVKNVNQKPQIVDFLPSSTITAKVNEPVIFHIVAKDSDQDKLSYEWSFSFHESRVKGTDTIERTFVTPGKKKVRVVVNDGRQEFAKEWEVQVLDEVARPSFDPNNFKVYVIEG